MKIITDSHTDHLTSLGWQGDIPAEIHCEESEYDHVYRAWRKSLPHADHETLHRKSVGTIAWKHHGPIGTKDVPAHVVQDAKLTESRAIRNHLREADVKHFPELKKELDDIEEAVKAGNIELVGLRSDVSATASLAAEIVGAEVRLFQAGVEKLAEDSRLDLADVVKLAKKFGWAIIALLSILILCTLFAPKAHGQFSKVNYINFQQDGTNLPGGFYTYPFTINCVVNVTCTPSGATLTIAASGGAATGYQTIKNATVAITQRTVINWISGSLGCVDNAGTSASDCSLTVPGSGSEIQYRSGANTLGAVTGSSVSGSGIYLSTDAITIPNNSCYWSYLADGTTHVCPFKVRSDNFLTFGLNGEVVTGGNITLNSAAVDGGTAVGIISSTQTAYSTAGAKLWSFRNNNVEKAYVTFDGVFNALTGFRINGAASSGKFLLGDGTNFINSGYTVPTSAGTAGKYVRWDGTNLITSTGSAAGTGTCTNQFVRVENADAGPTCSTVSLTADVTGVLPGANMGIATTSTRGAAIPRDGLSVDGSGNLDFNPGDYTVAYIYDEFLSGTSSTGMIGSLGWALNNITGAPTAAPQAGVYPNIGIVRLSTSASASTAASITTGTGTSGPPFGDIATTATNWEMNIIFRLNNSANNRVRIGFFNTNPVVNPTDGAYFRFDQNATPGDTTFHLCARRASGTETCSSSTLAADTNFHRLKIRSTAAGTWLMSLWSASGASDIAEITLATGAGGTGINLAPPTVNQQAGFLLGNDTTASAITVDADFFSFKIRGLAR